jgi:hypothetical protein
VHARVFEPAFEFDDMIPAVAKIVKIVNRLSTGFLDDVVEPGFAGINRRIAKIEVRAGNAPGDAGLERIKVAVGPACSATSPSQAAAPPELSGPFEQPR